MELISFSEGSLPSSVLANIVLQYKSRNVPSIASWRPTRNFDDITFITGDG